MPMYNGIIKTVLTLLLILTVNLLASPKDELNKAKNYFNFGDYKKTVIILKKNLPVLEKQDDKIQALELLGASLFFQNKKEEAKKQFRELLAIYDKAILDPLIYPPPLISFFNEIKKEFIRKNRMIKEILKKDKEKKEKKEKETIIKEIKFIETHKIEIKTEKNNYFNAFIPFGYAQYRNGQKGKAYIFLTAESILLTSNVISYFLTYSLKDPNGYYTGSNKTKAEVYNTITKYTFIAFVSFIAYGTIDGIVNYKPIFKKEITEFKTKPVKITLLNGNLINFKYEF